MVSSKRWLEIKIPINQDIEDAISNYLFENGSVGCYVIEGTIYAYFKKSDWNQSKVRKFKHYLKELTDLGFYVDPQNVELSELEDKDWNTHWKKSLKPIFVLPDLIIKPTWTHFIPQKDTLVIEIDPQMAFGTGDHATTQLMLKLIKTHVHQNNKILDIGTGSGILAIVAAKLTNSSVIACDIDPVAIFTAKQNISINSVSQNINLFTGAIDCIVNTSFDVILANINRKEISNLLSVLKNLLNPEGILILSGILIDEEEIILKELNNFNFNPLIIERQDEWLGLIVSR